GGRRGGAGARCWAPAGGGRRCRGGGAKIQPCSACEHTPGRRPVRTLPLLPRPAYYPALRDFLKARPLVQANGQAALWRRTGLANVVEVPIVLSFDYDSFDDYWSSFSTGPSRIGQRVAGLPAATRSAIERHVRAGYLAGMPDGPRSFAIIVRAVRGTVSDG